MTTPDDLAPDIEAQLLSQEPELDPTLCRAQGPGADCLSFVELAALAKTERTPSPQQLGHLDECLLCRTAVIVRVCGAPVAGHQLFREDAWKEHRARVPVWNEVVAAIERRRPRDNATPPWWQRQQVLVAAAATLLLVALPVLFLIRATGPATYDAVEIVDWKVLDDQGRSIERGSPSSKPVDEIRIRVHPMARAHVRLLLYDATGQRIVLQPESDADSMLLDPESYTLGPYGGFGVGRCDIVLTLSSREIPENRIDEVTPRRLPQVSQENRDAVLTQLTADIAERLGCKVLHRAVNSDRQ